MDRLPLDVPDLYCDHCLMTVRRQLRRLPGVETVSGDIRRKLLEITYDPKQTAAEIVLARLAEIGYAATRR